MRLLFAIASLGSLLALAGCGSTVQVHETSASAPPPIVLGTGIQTNGVATNRAIDVQFSTAMNAATLNPQTFLLVSSGGTTVPGAVTYDANNFVALFKPSAPLAVNTAYNATLTTGAASSTGVPLAAGYSFSFITRDSSDTSAIKVYETIPAANQAAVAVDATVKIVFTEGADPTTVNTKDVLVSNLNGSPVTGTVTYDIVTNYATFTPLSPLSPGTTYTVTITGVTDLAGQPMAQPYSFSFTTAGTATQVEDLLYESDVSAGTLSGWVADLSTGTLTATPGSPYSTGLEPVQMIPSPNGAYLYAIMGDQPPGVRGSNCFNFNTQVISYTVDHSTGALTRQQTLDLNGFCAPTGGAIDPTGHFLYVGESDGSSAGLIDVLSLGSGAQMTLLAGSPFAAPQAPAALAIDGNFLYAAVSDNFGPQGLLTFQRNRTTGAVQFVSGTTLPPQDSLVVSPSGNTLYTVGTGTGLISEFQVNTTSGALTPEGTVNSGTPTYGYELAADPQGRYVSLSSHNGTTVYTVSSTGTLLTTGIDATPLFLAAAPSYAVFDTTGMAAAVLDATKILVYGFNGSSQISLLAQTSGTANPGALTLFPK